MTEVAAKKLGVEPPLSISPNGMEIVWNPGNRGFSLLGADSIMFWLKPSMASVLVPLRDELGEDLYSQIIAFESSKGTYEDYHAMVTKMGKNFEEGFSNWGKAVSACGWGHFEVLKIDGASKHAMIRIEDPWELKIFDFKKKQNSVPFLNGKVSGIFTHAFGTNCRSEILEVSGTEDKTKFVVLSVKPSLKTLEQTLMEVHEAEKFSNQPLSRAMNSVLRRDQRRLLDVIETVGDVIWESDRNLQITYATDKAWKVLHLSDQDVIGKTWASILGEDQNLDLKNLLASLKSQNTFVEKEFEFSALDKAHWVFLRVKQLLDYNGNHLGYVGSASDITSQKELELKLRENQKDFQKSALEGAHQAGMAEIATGVLHNIGNILNSVNVSAEILRNTDLSVTVESFRLANQLLNENKAKWGDFLSNDTKGSKLPEFYSELEQALKQDCENLERESSELIKKIQLIKDVINLQQNFAGGVGFKEEISLQEIVENAVDMQLTSLNRHDIKIVRKFSKVKPILAQRGKLVHIVLNLIKNAKEAMAGAHKEKTLTLEVGYHNEREVFISIKDTGVGILPENLNKIFNHGFTTKKEGHGFGLHYCANALTEMGGKITVLSDGPDTGATFIINFKL